MATVKKTGLVKTKRITTPKVDVLDTTPISARELEAQILDREGIRVILLVSSKKKFDPWPYQRATAGDYNIAYFRDKRLKKHIGNDVEFLIVKSMVDITNRGQWLLSNLRVQD